MRVASKKILNSSEDKIQFLKNTLLEIERIRTTHYAEDKQSPAVIQYCKTENKKMIWSQESKLIILQKQIKTTAKEYINCIKGFKQMTDFPDEIFVGNGSTNSGKIDPFNVLQYKKLCVLASIYKTVKEHSMEAIIDLSTLITREKIDIDVLRQHRDKGWFKECFRSGYLGTLFRPKSDQYIRENIFTPQKLST